MRWLLPCLLTRLVPEDYNRPMASKPSGATVALCARNFGTRWLATIFGIVFLGHQIGGFTGAWLGGLIFDRTGSYDLMWSICIAAAGFAALVHLPVRDEPRVVQKLQRAVA